MAAVKIAVSKFALAAKIPPLDPFWPKFNASFQNLELEPDMIMQAVYDGHPTTTCHKNNWRAAENYVCGQHIGLDFDQGDKTSSIPFLVNDKFIARYASFIYSTPSHTDEAPRSRVIFVLDTPIMQPKNYTLAASALLWLYGTADRQCKDAVRFFYGSKGCNFEFPNQVLPLETIKKLIAQYQESGAQEKRRASRSDYHAPADQKEVEDALRVIPPWQIEYDEWVQVLMAIHSHFGDAGLAMAEHWGDGKDGEVERKWRSFKQEGNTAGAVTIATVFGLAKKFGWSKQYAQ